MKNTWVDYYPPIELVEEKLGRLRSEVLQKMLHASSEEEFGQAWKELHRLQRKMEFHSKYGKKRYLSPWQAGSLSTEEYEEMLSEIDTDSIPEIQYPCPNSKKSSMLQTLIRRLGLFLEKLLP